jgi:hypothetical protein
MFGQRYRVHTDPDIFEQDNIATDAPQRQVRIRPLDEDEQISC